MNITKDLYKENLALLTDFYQLTMAYAYWKSGKAEQESVFNLFIRKHPFEGGFTVTCGLEYVIDYINSFSFSESDIAYLSTLKGNDQQPMFEQGFLDYLLSMKFSCDVDAIPEGTVIFPHEPLIRVTGPILQCQLLETPLLNIVNFQSLIATKSARISYAAAGEPVLEFGLRRAQGIDGGLAASRAAYIGGCSSTSNILAGKLFGIPVSGTHAHSWVMSFEDELEAFHAYANAMPNNCIFLVDTYDTIKGISLAIQAGLKLREAGKEMIGIRLDSGDLAYFSIKAREMLDAAGFPDANIVASNDLDEKIIQSLKSQDARINVWGIGTKLVTAYDQPALGAVYKLVAIKRNGHWEDCIKLSEQAIKVNNPGIQQVKRLNSSNGFVADMIYDSHAEPKESAYIIDPLDPTRRKKLSLNNAHSKDLLQPIFRKGELVYQLPDIHSIRANLQKELAGFYKGIKRFVNPHSYPAGLEESLYQRKMNLILKLRNL